MRNFVNRCPFCGYSEFIEARQGGSDAYIAGECVWGQVLHHTVCRHCGSVVRSYVKSPEKLLKKQNRRENDL